MVEVRRGLWTVRGQDAAASVGFLVEIVLLQRRRWRELLFQLGEHAVEFHVVREVGGEYLAAEEAVADGPAVRPGSNQGNTCACAIRRQKALGSKEIGQNWPPEDHLKVLPEKGPF
jgi:hypothetical protein